MSADHENTTTLLGIFRYYGKDINVVEAFEMFKKCHKQEQSNVVYQKEIRASFLKALAELKYCGFISATR
jgi:hypothetical protein